MGAEPVAKHPLTWLVAAFAAVLLVPALFMDGMFMDGLIYSCVGKNLAQGQGTFWDPFFSATYMSSYHEQPPLMYGLESIFFRVLGTSFYVDRIYDLFMAIACFASLLFLWRSVTPIKLHSLFWACALFFFISPVTFWAYTNNVEEATMVVFALLSAALQFRGLQSTKNSTLWFVAGGLMLIASSMCKGAQGLFPVVVPFVWWTCTRTISFKKAIKATLIVTAVPVMFYLLIATYPPAANSYVKYYHDRIYATFNVATTATSSSHFFILFELLLDLLPAIFLSAIFAWIQRSMKSSYRREAMALFLIGMCGIIPLMITKEQRGFYLVTGLPFVTSAFALYFSDGIKRVSDRVIESVNWSRTVRFSAVALTAGTIIATIYLWGQPKRDAELLHDVNLIGVYCSGEPVIFTDDGTRKNWSLQGYLVRYHSIALSAEAVSDSCYYIVPKDVAPPNGMTKVDIPTSNYHLYHGEIADSDNP